MLQNFKMHPASRPYDQRFLDYCWTNRSAKFNMKLTAAIDVATSENIYNYLNAPPSGILVSCNLFWMFKF